MSVLGTRLDQADAGDLQTFLRRLFGQITKGDAAASLKFCTADATIMGMEAPHGLGPLCTLVQRKQLALTELDLLPSEDVAKIPAELQLRLFGERVEPGERVGIGHLAPPGGATRVSLGVVLRPPAPRDPRRLQRIFDPVAFALWARATEPGALPH